MSESENRYFFCDNHLITYWDKKSGEYGPLCSKSGCSHDTIDCIACTTKMDASLRESVYYYDGYVYMLGVGDGVYANLYRIKEDGSEFEKCFTFYRAEGFNDAKIPKLCFHRGYLYYVIPSQSTMKLQRIKLGDNKSEIVYEMSGERQNLYRVRAYGNHIFFQAGNFVDDKMMDINAGIFEYDLTTDEVKPVLDGAIREYGIYGNNLYYDKDNCIYELNFLICHQRK